MTKLLMMTDIAGETTYIPPFLAYAEKISMKLISATAQTITVPADCNCFICAVSPGAEVWVAKNNTAAAPLGSASNTNSELNPSGRSEIKPGDTLSLITTNASANVWIGFYDSNT